MRFLNYDNTLLDTQIVTQHNAALDPVKSGRISTPTKPMDVRYVYTFSSWSRTFNDITASVDIMASFSSSYRMYEITYADTDGTVMKKGSFRYEAHPWYNETAVKPNVANPEDYFPYIWKPVITKVVKDATVKMEWHNVIHDSWDDIVAAAHDGSYSTKYNCGDICYLDVQGSTDDTATDTIPMMLVGKDKDEDANGNLMPMTWLAVHPLAEKRRYADPSDKTTYHCRKTVVTTFSEVESTDEYYMGGRMFRSGNTTSSSACAAVFTLTANEAMTLTMKYFCAGYTNMNVLNVRVDGVWDVVNCSSESGASGEKEYTLTSGQTMEILAQFTKENENEYGRNCAEVAFVSDGDFTITQTKPAHTEEVGQLADGWKNSELRAVLESEVLPTLPEVLQQNIVAVKKTSDLDGTYQVETLDKLWIPSAREYNRVLDHETSGPIYSDVFSGTVNPAVKNGDWYENGKYCWIRTKWKGMLDALYDLDGMLSTGSYGEKQGVLIGFVIGGE